MIQNKLPALDLTLIVGCKLNCDYCPQDKLIARYYGEKKNRQRKLSFDYFKRALEKVEQGATIGFAGLAEPFLNDECSDMIVYAYKKGYKISLYTTLVGMKRADLEKIKNVKFDRLVVHIPDAEGKSKFDMDDEYLYILEQFHLYFDIDFYSCHGSIHPLIGDIVDRKKCPNFKPQNRAGNLQKEEFADINWKGRITCYRAWSSAAWSVTFTPEMLPDGTLLFCCQDYGLKHQIGNLVYQTWEEIQASNEFQKVEAGFQDDTIDTLCRKCSCARKIERLPTMQLQKAIQEQRKKDTNILKVEQGDLIDRFAKADNVCVFGLGKLFREHFFQEYWAEGLGVSFFSDNDEKLWGTKINGISCLKPEEMTNYSDLLVVLFVKQFCHEIIEQLNSLGVYNIITISEVLDICNVLFN